MVHLEGDVLIMLIYTVEELHESYNDWYELIWVGDDIRKAFRIAKDNWRTTRISVWKDGNRIKSKTIWK